MEKMEMNKETPISLEIQYLGLFENDPEWGDCLRYKIERFEDNARFNGLVFSLKPNSPEDSEDDTFPLDYRIEDGYFLHNPMDETQTTLFRRIIQELFDNLLKSVMDNLDGETDAAV